MYRKDSDHIYMDPYAMKEQEGSGKTAIYDTTIKGNDNSYYITNWFEKQNTCLKLYWIYS